MEDDPPRRAGKGPSCAVILGALASILAVGQPILSRLWHDRVVGPLGVKELDDRALYQVVLYPRRPKDFGGGNSDDTQWLLFFHDPGCGACRRLRPAFHAVAQLLNMPDALRFASFDCRQHRVICERLGADKLPVIRMYAATELTRAHAQERSSGSATKRPRRDPAAEYSGPLIGYEFIKWLQTLPGLSSADVQWPGEQELGDAILTYKSRGSSRVDSLLSEPAHARPGGFLTDASTAMRISIFDAGMAFPLADEGASQERLHALQQWINVLAKTFPRRDEREKLESLANLLGSDLQHLLQEASPRDKYRQMLLEQGLKIEDKYDWCYGGELVLESGVGGYSCSLWLLFHSMMANTYPSEADPELNTLHAINLWVEHFFSCRPCSAHFMDMWTSADHRGYTGRTAAYHSHEKASLWLWRAHNKVSARLAAEEGMSRKRQWPSTALCQTCYQDEYINGSAAAVSDRWYPKQWRQQYVYGLLQQLFCHDSDTYVCASFFDPSGYR
mmetsp:Transcript_8982/g.33873  ORF Transcript_8982/g.33873 Transcript_8982/m.33873 type:complete len:503 (-) Transcript_8982:31-1539(-)